MVFFLFKGIVIGLGFILISPLIALMVVFKIIAFIAKGIELYGQRKRKQSRIAGKNGGETKTAKYQSNCGRLLEEIRRNDLASAAKAHNSRKDDASLFDNDKNKSQTPSM